MNRLSAKKTEVKHTDLSVAHRWFLLILVSVGSSIIYTPIYLKNIFYDSLMKGLGLTNTELGALLSVYSVTAMICYLPAGMLADKIRMRTLSVVGMFLTSGLTFWYAMLPSLSALYIVFVGMGVSTILIWWGTRFKLIRLLFSEKEYPAKIGISYSVYGLAGLVIGLINSSIISLISDVTRSITILLLFLAVTIFVLGVLSLLFIPKFADEINNNKENKEEGMNFKNSLQVFKNPGVIWASVAMFFIYAVYQGITYTTPFMTSVFAAPLVVVSVVGLIRTYGIGLIAGPLAGKLAQLTQSPAKAIMIFLVATIAITLILLFLPQRSDTIMIFILAAMVVIIGFVTYGCFSIGSSTLTEAKVPLSIFGAASGMLSVVGFLPDTFLHAWFGAMIDEHGAEAYPVIFKLLILFAVIGIVAAWMARRYGIKVSNQG